MFPALGEVKRRRTSLSLTQANLAREAGVSQSFIAKIETGTTDPVYSKLKKIFDALDRIEQTGVRTARDIMSSDVFYVSVTDQMRKVVKLMKTHNISQVPVMEGGKCSGSVTDRTVLNAFAAGISTEDLMKTQVSKVMEGPFPTIEPEATVKSVSNLLSVYSAILVAENGKMIGIITRANLF